MALFIECLRRPHRAYQQHRQLHWRQDPTWRCLAWRSIYGRRRWFLCQWNHIPNFEVIHWSASQQWTKNDRPPHSRFIKRCRGQRIRFNGQTGQCSIEQNELNWAFRSTFDQQQDCIPWLVYWWSRCYLVAWTLKIVWESSIRRIVALLQWAYNCLLRWMATLQEHLRFFQFGTTNRTNSRRRKRIQRIHQNKQRKIHAEAKTPREAPEQDV